jgi:hypothetical protein
MRRAAAIAAVLVIAGGAAYSILVRRAARTPPAGPGGAPEMPSAAPAAAPDPEARAKLAVLEEILRSRNDNDPRLDREFNSLSTAAKSLFREKYRALPPEALNERGTIVFLLGRNLGAEQDWAFLRDVAGEPPCLSLGDCSKSPGRGGEEAAGDEVTLAYPSLVALKSAERAWSAGERQRALAVIAAGRGSRAPAVARLAQTLTRRLAPQAGDRR